MIEPNAQQVHTFSHRSMRPHSAKLLDLDNTTLMMISMNVGTAMIVVKLVIMMSHACLAKTSMRLQIQVFVNANKGGTILMRVIL